MVARFIAIPVSQGDAFFVETPKFSILVDGGGSAVAFPKLFERYTGRDGADIVICTHNDRDHASGILGYLRAGFGCGELWLPATWIETVLAIPEDVAEFDAQLWKGAREAASRYPEAEDVVAQYGSELSREASETESQTQDDRGRGRDDKELSERLERLMRVYERILDVHEADWFLLLRRWDVLWGARNRREAEAYRQLWEATGRLLGIVLEALHRGIPVRCFRYGVAALASSEPVRCINGAEKKRIRRRDRIEAVRALFLTVSNRESLVFWLPPGATHRGVLFTADAVLESGSLPGAAELTGAIITAPHHGSGQNGKVYKEIEGICKDVVWVRSDGYTRRRPCREYLCVNGLRFCTLCRGSNMQKQSVRLSARRGKWSARKGTRRCTCQ